MILQYALNKIQSINDVEVIHSVANSVKTNQLKTKRWILSHIQPYLDMYTDPKIVVAAGWHGLTAHLIDMNVVSFDKDPTCQSVHLFPNVIYKTEDIETFDPYKFDMIICTACEHISDEVINEFLSRKSPTSTAVLQSNNYYYIKDHINCKGNCDEFAEKINLRILEQHTLELEKYDRFMLIGV